MRVHRASAILVVLLMLAACGSVVESKFTEITPEPSSSAPPAARDCPGLDVTLSELIALGRGEARDCFGDSLLTLRGWVWEDLGAYDCVWEGLPGDPIPPDWLHCAATNHFRLTPVAYPPGEPPGFIDPAHGPFLAAVDPDSPAAGVVRLNEWVEVIGRFDDPVLELCGLIGDPLFHEECMSTFVVREARGIEAT